MRLPFNPAASPAPKPVKAGRQKQAAQATGLSDGCFSGPTAAFTKVTPAGKSWEHLNRIPAGEFYRITLDDSQPYYRIAGGLQDNESFAGPSQVPSKEGIRNSDWLALAGGDGFYVVFDPADRDIFYAESQEGFIHRFNSRIGEVRDSGPSRRKARSVIAFIGTRL